MTGLLIETFIPLTLLILLGYAIGRWQTIDLKSVATLAIYAITPIVAFGAGARIDFTALLLLLPIGTFLLACVIGLISFFLGKFLVKDSSRYLLPVACGSGNTGYFGLPVAMALFGEDIAGLYFLANLGVVIFETSIGYYFIARGSVTRAVAVRRVAQLPILYALMAGLLFSALHIKLPATVMELWDLSKAAYIVIGMMIAGIALSQTRTFALTTGLLSTALCGKFLLWPMAALLFGSVFSGFFPPETAKLILIMSLTPIAANLPAYAAANDMPVGPAALLVLISTMIALLGIPFLLPAFI